MEKILYNRREAAQLMGITTRTLANWEKRKQIKRERVSYTKQPRYSAEEINKAILKK